MRRVVAPSAAVVVVLLSAATVSCGDEGGTKVDVVLSEFVVEPDRDSVDAGEITFAVDNQGSETHEFLVVRADSADDLPVDQDGAFDEGSFDEDSLIGEAEDIEAGSDTELKLDLDSGTYVLLCNVVEEDEGEMESHFAEGMHAVLTVD
jgi:uncharacterized cupredoxin-like copper-binding protein